MGKTPCWEFLRPHSQHCDPVLVHLCMQKVLPGRDWAVGSGLRSASSPLPASSQAFAAASGDKMIFFILLIQLLEKNALFSCHG